MKTRYLTLLTGFIITIAGYGQVPDKIVVVESTYRPEVEQVEKLSSMPGLDDTSGVKPKINYSVLPSRLKTEYKLKPIKPAKIIDNRLNELYKSQVRLGLGNYNTPLVEFDIHSLRSKEYAVGAYAFHRSAHTKMELEDGNKVPGGYSRNRFNVHGKQFYRKANLEGEIYLNTDKYRLYGYNTDIVPDTITLKETDIRRYYTQLGARAEIYSTLIDSGKFQYRLGIGANYLGDDYVDGDNNEINLHIPVQITFPVKTFMLDARAEYKYFDRRFEDIMNKRHILQFNPQLKKRHNDWEVMLGINSYLLDSSEIAFFPEARLGFNVIHKVMQAYFGINGGVDVNSFDNLIRKNPYISSGLEVKDTRNKLSGYGGIKGKLAKNAGYLADVQFSTFQDYHFYINDSSTSLENQFNIAYDNMEQVRYRAELWYSPLSFLDFFMKGQYRSFKLSNETHPWHIPTFTWSFLSRYNFKQKIFVGADIIYLGERYAKDMYNLGNVIVLEPIWDLNLRLEYKYSQVISAFADFHNLLAKQYYIWNQYPTQKFNFLVGISYKF